MQRGRVEAGRRFKEGCLNVPRFWAQLSRLRYDQPKRPTAASQLDRHSEHFLSLTKRASIRGEHTYAGQKFWQEWKAADCRPEKLHTTERRAGLL
jgi:hypothetical protein